MDMESKHNAVSSEAETRALLDDWYLYYTYINGCLMHHICLIIGSFNYSRLNIFMWMQFIGYIHSFGHEYTVGAIINARKRPFCAHDP